MRIDVKLILKKVGRYSIAVTIIFCLMGCKMTPIKYAKVVNVKSTLNLREQPDTDAEVLCKLNKGEEVEICSEIQNGWIKVKSGDVTGYANASYIQVINSDKGKWLTNLLTSIQNLWSSIQNSYLYNIIFGESAGSIIKTIGYVIFGIIGIIILYFVIKGIFFILGILITIFCTGLGGGLLGGIIGFIISGWDFDAASVWMKWGFWIFLGIGGLFSIFNPREAASKGWDFPSYSSVGGSTESDEKIKPNRVDIYRTADGIPYYDDENGNRHMLRDETNGYAVSGDDGYYNENGYRVH